MRSQSKRLSSMRKRRIHEGKPRLRSAAKSLLGRAAGVRIWLPCVFGYQSAAVSLPTSSSTALHAHILHNCCVAHAEGGSQRQRSTGGPSRGEGSGAGRGGDDGGVADCADVKPSELVRLQPSFRHTHAHNGHFAFAQLIILFLLFPPRPRSRAPKTGLRRRRAR